MNRLESCVLAVGMVINVGTAGAWDPPAGTLLWQDNFEDGRLLSAKYEDVSDRGMAVSADDAFDGSHSLKQTYAQGQVDAGWVSKFASGGFPDRVFVRWYHKFETGFQGYPAKMARIRYRNPDWRGPLAVHCWAAGDNSGRMALDVRAEDSHQRNSAGFLPIALTRFTFANPTNIGRWVCFEMEVQLNTPGKTDGHYRLWIDDQLEVERMNVDLRGNRTYKINEIMLDCYWNDGSPRPQSRYYDAFVISRAKIGPARPASALHIHGADLRHALLTWPTNDPGCVIQTASSLANASPWMPVTNPPVIVQGEHRLRVPAINSQGYFRLHRPGFLPGDTRWPAPPGAGAG